jgi:hypothetical protein
MNGLGVVTALAAHEHVTALERVDVVGVLDGARGLAHVGSGLAGLRGREERGLEQLEVLFGLHPLEEDRTDHASITNDSNAACHFRSAKH